VKPIADEITVRASTSSFRGNIVQIRTGSGLVRRCPVEGCGRVLSRQNYCPNHEIQKDFVYDMRVKAVVDDGEKAKNIHVPTKVVESSCGITLQEAIKIAETSPMGFDEVLTKIRAKLLGRYYIVEGTEYPDRIFVTKLVPDVLNKAKAERLMTEVGV
jgi:replication factor A1